VLDVDGGEEGIEEGEVAVVEEAGEGFKGESFIGGWVAHGFPLVL
jgi:hypothetical protein